MASVALAHSSVSQAVEGVTLRADAKGADNDLIASVFVGTSAGRICAGTVRHAGKQIRLPELQTGKSGNARWRWKIGAGVPAGRWEVSVRCQLANGPATEHTSFKASGTGRRGDSNLVAPGSMTKKSLHHAKGSKGGRGGGEEEENGYPKGLCTWWARLKRPDIPVFPGPAGDARNWAESARRAKPRFSLGTVAKPGAIVVFQPGQAGAGRFGHVAYVERVNASEMTISEANFRNTKPGHERPMRWRGRGFDFIYAREERIVDPPAPPNSQRFRVYRTCANGKCGLPQRQGPGLSFGTVGRPLPDDSAVDVVCQTRGDRVSGFDATSTNVWDRLANGAHVSDYFVDTPGKNDQFSVQIPSCASLGAAAEVEIPHVATVALSVPGNGQVLSGDVAVRASSDAPEVRFEAFYSDTPGVEGTARWHPLGVDSNPGDGFELSWDTTAVPNQGLRREGTVRVSATAVDAATAVADRQDFRHVAIANADPAGDFAYHVFGTCLDALCTLKRRAGPGFSKYPPIDSVAEGATVKIACQAAGETVSGGVGTSNVWNQLDDESWVADLYIDTPIAGSFSPPIPRCATVPPPPTPTIALTAPASGGMVSGTVEVAATSDAPGVRFEAFYSDTPGVSGTALWRQLGDDLSPGDGFELSWDTTAVPNQGQASQSTVRVRTVALDYQGGATGVQEVGRVNVSNPSPDGSYAYHVYGTCGSDACFVNVRSGPSQTTYPVIYTKDEGERLDIACQAHGQSVSNGVISSDIWNKLIDGGWVTDLYVDTPVAGDFSPPIPQC
ncbi:MAG TPA: CHAP domain-containing protein [Solirubrobacterales bacterium]|nr:CHAP domain-containing protein [Solirubrobacterales bacterium]